ncbi:phytanoyl-CoA dioxygenase family protein [Variovorax sp. RA8]|uniref:phytanoyl-CoA dioxygenase family protein n=1 Tax=Variovorax sp. (strain JCM 16519 / RA8) TaxID=662548 RepID=UPI000AA343A6|nr:phytanoyl-CoA dioxygenase family protein [Variovorax sp. RA8]VTU15148.1 Phytanoyl-CoA dioxygenase (PhyH) [Variovorax sp. RA8]
MNQEAREIPSACYGVLERVAAEGPLAEAAEQVRILGYATIDSGYKQAELQVLSQAFDEIREAYIARHGQAYLESLDELNNIRLMLAYGDGAFLRLALNEHVLKTVAMLISGKFVLNQQNGVINPPLETYNQGAWHRDLPYQHFVSTTPLAINALFCMDDFTADNGATFVLPASHRNGPFPSPGHVRKNAVQVEARAGQFILLDCMAFHSGGYNRSSRARRAVNHVYTIPYFKQQIKIAGVLDGDLLPPHAREILGFDFQEPLSVDGYLESRRKPGA